MQLGQAERVNVRAKMDNSVCGGGGGGCEAAEKGENKRIKKPSLLTKKSNFR